MRKGSTSFGACEVRCWRWLFGNKTPFSTALPPVTLQHEHVPGHTPCFSRLNGGVVIECTMFNASQRRGDDFTRRKEFNLEAKVRIWPWSSHVCRIRSISVPAGLMSPAARPHKGRRSTHDHRLDGNSTGGRKRRWAASSTCANAPSSECTTHRQAGTASRVGATLPTGTLYHTAGYEGSCGC
jgi:hypothetical protein